MNRNQEFSLTIHEHQNKLGKLALKFTSDPDEIQELVQETIVRSLRFMDQYFNNPRVVSWLFVIMRNVYISRYRKHKKNILFEKQERSSFKNQGYPCPVTQNSIMEKLLQADVKQELEKFPDDYYTIFMNYCDGYKYRELAEIHGIPEGTVKTRIHHMRKHLQKKLKTYLHTS